MMVELEVLTSDAGRCGVGMCIRGGVVETGIVATGDDDNGRGNHGIQVSESRSPIPNVGSKLIFGVHSVRFEMNQSFSPSESNPKVRQ